MVRHLLTAKEREILQKYTYDYGKNMEDKGHLNVILYRLRKLDLDRIRFDLDLIHKALKVKVVNRIFKRTQ